MKSYEIVNTASGRSLGIYQGETTDEAWRACAADAGYPEGREREKYVEVKEVPRIKTDGSGHLAEGEYARAQINAGRGLYVNQRTEIRYLGPNRYFTGEVGCCSGGELAGYAHPEGDGYHVEWI